MPKTITEWEAESFVMEIVRAENIVKNYKGTGNVLDGISLSINKGEFVSVLGASGSGKTTLLSVLGGIERPDGGKVFIGGREITGLRERDLAVLRRTEISFVFQFFNLAPYLTAEQNILVPVLLAGKRRKDVADRLDFLLDFMGQKGRKDSFPDKLSGGEQQRTAIARGLIFNPEIIFLDEPTGNLDSVNALAVMRLLSEINRKTGTTVIQVTHSEENALFGTRIIKIKDGRITDDYQTGERI